MHWCAESLSLSGAVAGIDSSIEFRSPSRDLKPDLLKRDYADFANLPCEEALERLLNGLRRELKRKRRTTGV